MDFIFDSSLVLYLPLHQLDGTSFMSKDAYGHLCTVTGATWRLNVRYFVGTDDLINCGTDSRMILTNKFALEAWVKADEVAQGTQGVLTRRVLVYDGYQLNITTDNASVWVSNGSTWKNAASGSVISVGEWYHLVGTFDNSLASGNLRIYVNGILKGSTDTTITISCTSSSPVKVGTTYTGGIYYTLEGFVGETRIYSRPLTPQEIQHNYLATKWRYR